jgi:uncharacterized protein (DUF2249 family)
MISGEMTVARLLAEHPTLLDVLVDYHPHFKQLRNRLLRRVMAPLVSVSQAARMAGVPEAELLSALRQAADSLGPRLAAGSRTDSPTPLGSNSAAAAPRASAPAAPFAPVARPPALAALAPERQVHVDVRDDIRRGEEPFTKIMAAVKGLGPDAALVLRVPFEPIPLYDVLGKRGFSHWTECRDPGDWSVWFYHLGDLAAPPAPPGTGHAPVAAAGTITIDVRGLEPPRPMVRVLEALDTLAPGQRLEVIHDRRPLFLYPQLEAQGFAHETEEPAPGLVRILIRRGS